MQNNTKIIDRHKNWNILLSKEVLKIKKIDLILNSGLQVSNL